ncbi:MAG: amidohydrolase [Chloroflexi bacterium]|nr:amidohydrolase [Chloroflexota bacterium]MDA8187766.1 amidohydrolase family protein [Dehalococcoidales bacterium]
MKIDLHTHFYPPKYFEFLEEHNTKYEMTKDATGKKILKHKGARFLTITPEMTSPENRLKQMDEVGVDVQVLSLSVPNVYFSDDDNNLYLARETNDYLAALRDRYPKRFWCLASVPLGNVEHALRELDRAINQLGMNGVIVGSNIDGRPLNSPEFEPFWAACNRMKLTVTMHPMPPLGSELMFEYGLAPMVGFIFDSTLAAARMAYDGIFERYPDMKLVLPHLGGAIPYIVERLDNGFRAIPDCRERISRLPSEYLKNVYYDTVSFHAPALMCAYHTVGVDRIVMGSDYPHIIGHIDRAVTSIEELDIPDEDKEKIFSGNALKMLTNL